MLTIYRLQGCQPDVEVWQRVLQVRSLVLSPDEDTTMWIKFGNLCGKAKRYALAEKIFDSLVPLNATVSKEGFYLRRPFGVLVGEIRTTPSGLCTAQTSVGRKP